MAGDFFTQDEEMPIQEKGEKKKQHVADFYELQMKIDTLKGKYKIENEGKMQLIGEEILVLEGIEGKDEGDIQKIYKTIMGNQVLSELNIGRDVLDILRSFKRYIRHNKDFFYNINKYYIPDFIWLLESSILLYNGLKNDNAELLKKIEELKQTQEDSKDFKERELVDNAAYWIEYQNSDRGRWLLENIVPSLTCNMKYVRTQNPTQMKELVETDRTFMKYLQKTNQLPYQDYPIVRNNPIKKQEECNDVSNPSNEEVTNKVENNTKNNNFF